MLFVVGTGRCGTGTLATHYTNQGYDSRHESHNELLVELAFRYTLGQISDQQAAGLILKWCQFGQVESHYKTAELIRPLSLIEHTEFLWVHRRPLDTVASMVAKGWYHRDEIDMFPVSFTWWDFSDEDDGPALLFDVNWRAFRTGPHHLGEMSLGEWRELGQVGRCAWWWDWCNRRIMGTLPAGSGRLPVESVGLRENRGPGHRLGATDTRLVEATCGQLEAELYDNGN